ncbi:MAG: DUF1311 domain-containing protein [Comamonadaceae bacterium]|nr:MAG: DUF1311 domain-containing protein [Comamonadaceae bacterium]
MEEIGKLVLAAVIAALVTASGFGLKRLITSAKRQERATLYSSLADLRSKMETAGVSFDDLDRFEAQIRSKARETSVALEAAGEPDSYWTQGEMNHRARVDLELQDAELAVLLAELGGLVGEKRRVELDAAQEAWVRYRDLEAGFAASEYTGGSIMPLIRASEAASLTRERVAHIRAFLDDRKSRYA